MSENQPDSLLINMARDIGQIKTDLAVNTTKTTAIEDHLKQLNGKVVKREEQNLADDRRFRLIEEQNQLTAEFIKDQQNLKRRRSDNRTELLQKLFLMIVGPLAIAIWQIVQYLIHQGVFK